MFQITITISIIAYFISERFKSIQVGGWPAWSQGHAILLYLVTIYVMCLFSACRMKRLKGCLDSSTSTAWECAGLMCNLYRDAA